MSTKKILLTFSILSLVVWSASWWAYKAFIWLDAGLFTYRKIKMYVIAVALVVWALGFILRQMMLLVKNKSDSIAIKIGLNVIILSFVGFYALLASVAQEGVWACGFLSRYGYSLKNLVTIILAASGLDIIFFFFLALISGYIIYSPTNKSNVREFLKLLGAWFFIIFINEMVVQRFIFTFRTSSMSDIFNNMLGGVLPGLVLSLKWFRR